MTNLLPDNEKPTLEDLAKLHRLAQLDLYTISDATDVTNPERRRRVDKIMTLFYDMLVDLYKPEESDTDA